MKLTRGFTLIELLVVMALVALLSSMVVASLSIARTKARDLRRREDTRQIAFGVAARQVDTGFFHPGLGWLDLGANGAAYTNFVNALVPTYISTVSGDPTGEITGLAYMYFRKDVSSAFQPCFTLNDSNKFAVYARLERPTQEDLDSFTDSFDACVRSVWGMNFRAGN